MCPQDILHSACSFKNGINQKKYWPHHVINMLIHSLYNDYDFDLFKINSVEYMKQRSTASLRKMIVER